MSKSSRKTASPDADPVNDLSRAEVARRLYGSRSGRTDAWGWAPPDASDRLPIDEVVTCLIRRRERAAAKAAVSAAVKEAPALVSFFPQSPFLFVRRSIAGAAEDATRYWRLRTEMEAQRAQLAALLDGIRSTMATLGSFAEGRVSAETLTADLEAVLPRRVGDPRIEELDRLGADIELISGVMIHLAPTLSRLEARTGELIDQVRSPVGRPRDMWAQAFTESLCRSWRAMTGDEGSYSAKSQHHLFILSAYRSLGGKHRTSFIAPIRAWLKANPYKKPLILIE